MARRVTPGFCKLVRLLTNHPVAEIRFGTSESSAGQLLSDVFPCPYDLKLIRADDVHRCLRPMLHFCACPTPSLWKLVRRVLDAGVKAIDLSADFRLRDAATYERWYGVKHTATDLLVQAVYGFA